MTSTEYSTEIATQGWKVSISVTKENKNPPTCSPTCLILMKKFSA